MEESAGCSCCEVSALTKRIWKASAEARIRRGQCRALHLRCAQIDGYVLAWRTGGSAQELERRGGRAMLEVVRILRRALKLVADAGGEHWLQRGMLRLEARDEFRVVVDDLEDAAEALVEAMGGDHLRHRYLEDRCLVQEELQSAAARDRAKLEAKLARMAPADPVSEHVLQRLRNRWSANSPLRLDSGEVSWESKAPLGKGASGTVYRADWLGFPVAVKLFKPDDYSFQREVEAMGSLAVPHPHVLQMIGVLDHEQRDRERGIVMELMRMDLRRYLDSRRGMLLLQSEVDLLLQIARGIRYLHDHNVLHRDLKPQNVLVDFDDDQLGVSVALTDFGVARTEFDTLVNGSLTDRRGTPRYMAPEMMESDLQYSRKVDVYSFAVLCSEVLTGAPPFAEDRLIPFEELRRIVSNGRRPVLPKSCPDDLRALIDRCWSADPAARPLFPEIEQELARIKRRLLQLSVAPAMAMSQSQSSSSVSRIQRRFLQLSVAPAMAMSQSQSSCSTSSSSVSMPVEDRASLPSVEELKFRGAPEIGSEINVRFRAGNGAKYVICRWIREGDNGVADHHEEMKPVLVAVSDDDKDYAQLRYVVTAGDYKKKLVLQCLPFNSEVRTGLMARKSTGRIRFSQDLKDSIDKSYSKGQATFQLQSHWWQSPGKLLINRTDYLLWFGQGNPNNHRFQFLDSGVAELPPPIKLSKAGCDLTRNDGSSFPVKFTSGSSRDRAVLTMMYFWEKRFDAAPQSSSRE